MEGDQRPDNACAKRGPAKSSKRRFGDTKSTVPPASTRIMVPAPTTTDSYLPLVATGLAAGTPLLGRINTLRSPETYRFRVLLLRLRCPPPPPLILSSSSSSAFYLVLSARMFWGPFGCLRGLGASPPRPAWIRQGAP